MHIPDGFIDAPTSAAAGAVAIGGVAVSLRQARASLDERQVPMAGLVSAFVFAGQMLNFPVAAGTSGHLLGGVLAAVLVGPWLGSLCVSVVLVLQALLFADGGLSALGLNVINMALVGAWGGYAVFLLVRRLLPRVLAAVPVASGIAGGLAPVLAAVAFTVEYAIGGNDAAPLATVGGAMVGVHVLIGIGEGIISALTVAAVLAVRPDLVYGARELVAARAAGNVGVEGRVTARRGATVGILVAVGLLASVVLAFAVAPFASSAPDGLEKVAADQGLDAGARDHALGTSPLADYAVSPVEDARLSTAVAGIIGVGITFGIALGAFALVRRRRPSGPSRRHSLAEGLYVEGDSPVHRLAPHCKVAATVLFVLAVVLTPRDAFAVFALDAVLVLTVVAVAGLPAGVVGRRLVVEVPFVAFALVLPLIGRGPDVQVLGLSLSVAGLWAAWGILVKATLGLAASIALASTTRMSDLLIGLERLRVPKVLVAIAGFMVRYADVIVGEMHRMKVARLSRGHDPRWIWQARAVATSAGALFIRSYERGERVHLAMMSRGYGGSMPDFARPATPRRDWARALCVPVLALAAALVGWWWT